MPEITAHPSERDFPEAAPRPERPRISFRELRRLVAEDHATNARSRLKWTLLTPGFQALLAYRLGVWCHGLRRAPLRVPVRLAAWSMSCVARNLYGIEIYPTARIGRRFRIAHQHGIVINPLAAIGDDCTVRQGVTIGGGGLRSTGGAPRLGDRVQIGAGAVLAGPISIGDDAVIGPNAVVLTDVPAGSIVTAPPARIMRPPPRRAAAGTSPGTPPVAAAQDTGRTP